MARRIFISFQYEDQLKAKGFRLLSWNKNVDVDFVGRHLLDPVDSNNWDYINRKIKEQIIGSSVTVVLLGKTTCQSTAVANEIEMSLKKDKPNGILAIRLETTAPLPPDSPVGKILLSSGAEIIDWLPHRFSDAIERAACAAGRARNITQSSRGMLGCSR